MIQDRALFRIDVGPFHLWSADPNDISSMPVTQACIQLLSDAERTRWRRLRTEIGRREYLTTRMLVRTALSHYHPLSPAEWRFRANAYGKPSVEPDCGLSFNLSNSPGLVVCLIARECEVGVDVEPYDRAGEIVELAADLFSRQELAQLDRLHGQERLDRALSLWTLKEAYCKAWGLGLSMPLGEFSFLFDDEGGVRLNVNPEWNNGVGSDWWFRLVDHAGHRIALVAKQPIGTTFHLVFPVIADVMPG